MSSRRPFNWQQIRIDIQSVPSLIVTAAVGSVALFGVGAIVGGQVAQAAHESPQASQPSSGQTGFMRPVERTDTSYHAELRGEPSGAQPSRVQDAVPGPEGVLVAARTTPPPATPTSRPPAPAGGDVTESAAGAGVQPPPSSVSPAARPSAPVKTWSVQLVAVDKRDEAQTLAARLMDLGYKAYTEPTRTSKGLAWRVRVGPVPTRDEAERLRAEIQSKHRMSGQTTTTSPTPAASAPVTSGAHP